MSNIIVAKIIYAIAGCAYCFVLGDIFELIFSEKKE